MDTKVIQAGVAPHVEALGACYTTNLKRRRWLGGHLVIHWDIQSDGTVTAVRLAESDLGNWPIERCVLEVARSATFGKPIGGDADFQIPLDFSAKGRLISWDADDQARRGGQAPRRAGQARPRPCAIRARCRSPSGVHPLHAVRRPASRGRAHRRRWFDCGKTVMAMTLSDPKGKVAKLAFKHNPGVGLAAPDPRGHIAKLAVKYRD